MGAPGITHERFSNQQVLRPRFSDAGELLRWMGAIQAQDPLGSLWAVGQRLAGASEADVEAAIAKRTIVRTWPMRGTLHYVPAADVRWMLRLLTPRVVARSKGRYRELELDDVVLRKSGAILTRALEGGRRLTRPQAYEALSRGGVSPAAQRGIHIIGHLAQSGLLCLGSREGKQATLALLDEWVPPARELPSDEALALLAERYFASHGPASLQDFAWWSGLHVRRAAEAIASVGSALTRDEDGRRWRAPSVAACAAPQGPIAVLLPPWDEFLVAYRDRTDVISQRVAQRNPLSVVGRSLIVIDGRVRGSWRRTLSEGAVSLSWDLWSAVTRAERQALDAAGARYAAFLGRVLVARRTPRGVDAGT